MRYFYFSFVCQQGNRTWYNGMILPPKTKYPSLTEMQNEVLAYHGYQSTLAVSITNVIEFKDEADYEAFRSRNQNDWK